MILRIVINLSFTIDVGVLSIFFHQVYISFAGFSTSTHTLSLFSFILGQEEGSKIGLRLVWALPSGVLCAALLSFWACRLADSLDMAQGCTL